MSIEVVFQKDCGFFTCKCLKSLWERAIAKVSVRVGLKERDISVAFVSQEKIRELNQKYRDKDEPTDVLAFEYGEVVVCPEVVKTNAGEYRVPVSEELLRVITHGMLHLVGCKHEPYKFSGEKNGVLSPEAEKMFCQQERIVNETRFDVFYPRLIVGLGNPGDKYDNTRHNVGFDWVNSFTKLLKNDGKWLVEFDGSHGAMIARARQKGCSCSGIVLAKPTGGMNRSGAVVADLCKAENIDPRQDLIVIHDDLDLAIGTYKVTYAKGDKTHRGIKDIERSIKTKRFWRMRIGIENRKEEGAKRKLSGSEYVLQKFKEDEKSLVERVVNKTIKNIKRNTK